MSAPRSGYGPRTQRGPAFPSRNGLFFCNRPKRRRATAMSLAEPLETLRSAINDFRNGLTRRPAAATRRSVELDFRHASVKRGPIQYQARPRRRNFLLEAIAPGAAYNGVVWPRCRVRDAGQPADHGAVAVQDALALKIGRAHRAAVLVAQRRAILCQDCQTRPLPHFSLDRAGEFMESEAEIRHFRVGMDRQIHCAAGRAVASLATERPLPGCGVVCCVHVLVKNLESVDEIVFQGRFPFFGDAAGAAVLRRACRLCAGRRSRWADLRNLARSPWPRYCAPLPPPLASAIS